MYLGMDRDERDDLEKTKSESDEEYIKLAGWAWRVLYVHQDDSNDGTDVRSNWDYWNLDTAAGHEISIRFNKV